jgi:acid stress chaperone HdeB
MRTRMRAVRGIFPTALLGALLGAVLFSATQTRAEIIDLSTLSCSKFVQSDKEEIGTILTWLNGYYRDEDDPPVIDTDKFVADSKRLGEFCAANPTVGLITAADKLFAR